MYKATHTYMCRYKELAALYKCTHTHTFRAAKTRPKFTFSVILTQERTTKQTLLNVKRQSRKLKTSFWSSLKKTKEKKQIGKRADNMLLYMVNKKLLKDMF